MRIVGDALLALCGSVPREVLQLRLDKYGDANERAAFTAWLVCDAVRCAYCAECGVVRRVCTRKVCIVSTGTSEGGGARARMTRLSHRFRRKVYYCAHAEQWALQTSHSTGYARVRVCCSAATCACGVVSLPSTTTISVRSSMTRQSTMRYR
jgi:hypothetical protein